MNSNFPGHYPSSPSACAASTVLIHLSEAAFSEKGAEGVDARLLKTLFTTPNSPMSTASRSSRASLQTECSIVVEELPDSPQLTHPILEFSPHPRYNYNDGTLFITVDMYIFRVHSYLFLPDDGNYIAGRLREGFGTFLSPAQLPEIVKIGSFETLLDLLYRHPLDQKPFSTRSLKDACLTAHSLNMGRHCDLIAKFIISNDCPDEPLDEAVPKYALSVKLPTYFPATFKEEQFDKICCSIQQMTHAHFYEIGFFELSKIWKCALTARIGYDGVKVETYDPPHAQRTSYLIKVKNMPAYRAMKRESKMPLPDERPRQSVANLIGKFEQGAKRNSGSAGTKGPGQGPSAQPLKPQYTGASTSGVSVQSAVRSPIIKSSDIPTTSGADVPAWRAAMIQQNAEPPAETKDEPVAQDTQPEAPEKAPEVDQATEPVKEEKQPEVVPPESPKKETRAAKAAEKKATKPAATTSSSAATKSRTVVAASKTTGTTQPPATKAAKSPSVSRPATLSKAASSSASKSTRPSVVPPAASTAGKPQAGSTATNRLSAQTASSKARTAGTSTAGGPSSSVAKSTSAPTTGAARSSSAMAKRTATSGVASTATSPRKPVTKTAPATSSSAPVKKAPVPRATPSTSSQPSSSAAPVKKITLKSSSLTRPAGSKTAPSKPSTSTKVPQTAAPTDATLIPAGVGVAAGVIAGTAAVTSLASDQTSGERAPTEVETGPEEGLSKLEQDVTEPEVEHAQTHPDTEETAEQIMPAEDVDSHEDGHELQEAEAGSHHEDEIHEEYGEHDAEHELDNEAEDAIHDEEHPYDETEAHGEDLSERGDGAEEVQHVEDSESHEENHEVPPDSPVSQQHEDTSQGDELEDAVALLEGGKAPNDLFSPGYTATTEGEVHDPVSPKLAEIKVDNIPDE
ncbi:related to proteophosphoglycan ppg4-Leishmania infantum [Serendipita indica DSM 11827]|uniref:Related to proteophosphoglycan ppg4-Leishmania infantum n=1 Tax=Serendipita indica (strain DSM 11827) TaxID=1109443 RepID=G4TBV7_SERID|nr:related to proteophosphoglycan ppg4-Leishmania infantum [Serendipita indica DSM 11827]